MTAKKVDEYEVNSDITKRLIVQHDFDDFDLMEIEFTKTKEPFNRIVVDYFSFGDITDFTMERQDMTSFSKINQTGACQGSQSAMLFLPERNCGRNSY